MSFDFDAAVRAPFRMHPGLRRLAAGATQLTPLYPGARHQREKLAVLSAFPGLALQRQAGFDATPALHALASHAAAEHPAAWTWDGQRAVANILGTAVQGGEVQPLAPGRFGLGDEVARCLQALPPEWRLTGLLSLAFAEDFAVVDADQGTIPWLAVTLPSHWAPEDKLGLAFDVVHAAVADSQAVTRAADALLALVTGGERWERFVWNVTGHPRLHAHPRHVDPQRWPADIGFTLPAGAWWRTERQTFLPVTSTALSVRQAVFTIEVQCQPLAQAITQAAQAGALHDAVASMTPAVLAYRSLGPVQAPLLRWLDSLR